MTRNGWVVLADSLRPQRAELLVQLLESAGIPARVEQAVAADLYPISVAIRGAKLLVPAVAAARASDVLASSGTGREPPDHGVVELGDSDWKDAPAPAEGARESIWRGRLWPWVLVAASCFAVGRCVLHWVETGP